MKIDNARINNLSIFREDINGIKMARVEFDIYTPIGEFHYDSDTQPIREIVKILSDIGIHFYTNGMIGIPDVELSICATRGDNDCKPVI